MPRSGRVYFLQQVAVLWLIRSNIAVPTRRRPRGPPTGGRRHKRGQDIAKCPAPWP